MKQREYWQVESLFISKVEENFKYFPDTSLLIQFLLYTEMASFYILEEEEKQK